MVGRGPILHFQILASIVLVCSAVSVVLMSRYTGSLGKFYFLGCMHGQKYIYIYCNISIARPRRLCVYKNIAQAKCLFPLLV